MNSPLIRRLATTAVALLLLLYVGYQVFLSHHSGVRTETSVYFTASDSVQVTGVAVRDEIPLEKPKTAGVVDYVLSSGDKVAKGGTVALICSTEQQAAARHELAGVDSEIKRLQSLQSPGDTHAVSPDSLNQQIHRKLSSLLGQTVSGEFASLPASREDLLYLISERQIVTGQTSNLDSRLTELQKTRETLTQQAGTALGSVVSPASGYFISSTDGLESELDFSKATSLTGEQILAAEQEQAADDGSPGKISGSYDWYFACVVDSNRTEDFRRLASGGTVSIRFPFVSNVTVPATVAAVNQSSPSSQTAVILECNYMNAELAAIRRETAQVIVQEYTGIRISPQAVHFETVSKTEKDSSGKATTTKKEVSGVYVLHGNQISFRQIVPIYSTDNYVICDPNPPEDSLMTDDTVKLHDEVVVEGTDLYDGKVVQ